MILGRGPARVELMRLPSVHAEDMLVAFVPAVGALFNSDMYAPGAPPRIREARCGPIIRRDQPRSLASTGAMRIIASPSVVSSTAVKQRRAKPA